LDTTYSVRRPFGVRYLVIARHLGGLYPDLPGGVAGVQLLVPDDRVEAAQSLLKDV
jgi:hypothetical protein